MSSAHVSSSGQKTFIPLENNPTVFSKLSAEIGLGPGLTFHDVYSIDDPDLVALIPRPVQALLFTCPTEVFRRARGAELEQMIAYEGSGDKEPVIWYRQTIGHACGLIALLHGLSNGGARRYIKAGSTLASLIEEAAPLPPTERAQLLYDSPELERAHYSAAVVGDTQAPSPEAENHNHYICFSKGNDGHLWELNGGMKGPLHRGELNADEDMLSDRALQLGVRTFLAHAQPHNVEFSMVALAAI